MSLSTSSTVQGTEKLSPINCKQNDATFIKSLNNQQQAEQAFVCRIIFELTKHMATYVDKASCLKL